MQEPCLPLGIDPIHSYADTYDQGDAQLGGALHMAFYHVRGGFLLPTRHLNHKLVMNLQDHARRKPLLLQGPGDADHCNLDQVRRRALQGGVGGSALAECADVIVAVLELRDVAPSSEQCLDISPFSSLGDGAIEPGSDAGEAREVLLDESLRFVLGNAELARQRERS